MILKEVIQVLGVVMKIVEQAVNIIGIYDEKKILSNIEHAGRTAYQSFKNVKEGSAEKFVKKIIRLGHESVLEHQSVTMYIRSNRAILNELVRHRIASYTQSSTRYIKYKDNIEFIVPHGYKGYMDSATTVRPTGLISYAYVEDIFFNNWTAMCEDAEDTYHEALANGVKPEIARDLLPLSLASEITVTMNLRAWRHFLKLRLDKHAHPQMRELAGMIRDTLYNIVPIVFEEYMDLD
jgi:thymidylate synthase (FAD)